jgi:hypothetical protein
MHLATHTVYLHTCLTTSLAKSYSEISPPEKKKKEEKGTGDESVQAPDES